MAGLFTHRIFLTGSLFCFALLAGKSVHQVFSSSDRPKRNAGCLSAAINISGIVITGWLLIK